MRLDEAWYIFVLNRDSVVIICIAWRLLTVFRFARTRGCAAKKNHPLGNGVALNW